MHPGLPQGPVPDRQHFAEIRNQDQARRHLEQEAATLTVAEARLRQQGTSDCLVAPTALVYPITALQASGRLMADNKLDLSPNTVMS